ncbi:MAG TPA: hypothetical protein HPP94_06375 [Desulfuromonadales bacterium]|nr:hypothetical protein [Desulfuromonadales bacterium]
MKRVIVVLSVFAMAGAVSGCNKKGNTPPAAVAAKAAQVQKAPGQMNDGELALAFLGCVQNNDKKLMYEVSNLTAERVEESREKLTNTAKYKQTSQERTATEHALRMSGSIDFYLKKMTKILPASAQLEIIKSEQEKKSESAVNIHSIKISYSNKDEAPADKSGKSVKDMVVKLKQIKHVVNGVTLREFIFDSKDFEKMADKDYEVVSYY